MTSTFGITIPHGPRFEPRLAHTFASLAAQPVPVKVALCDASDDRRVHVLADRYAPLIAYRRHGPDAGQSAAINEGWEALDTDVLGWLNADDCLSPNALATVAAAFVAEPQTDVFYGQSLIANDQGHIIGVHPAIKPPSDRLYRDDIISQPSCFVRSGAVRSVGGVGDNLHYVMDWDLWCRLYEAGARFTMTKEVLSLVVWAADTKTANLFGRRFSEIDSVLKARVGPVARATSLASFTKFHLLQYGPRGRKDHQTYKEPWKDVVDGSDVIRLPVFTYKDDVKKIRAVLSEAGPVCLSTQDETVRGDAPFVDATLLLDPASESEVVLTAPNVAARLSSLMLIDATD
ncbi:glycosyltransferase [Parvularcula dongshanensis]|uniref:Glycosyltransferase involved in cell wall biosynthesis n=1 Tax=Parvularcula dongshanensis TaxID=1173995 RepID=A0A840I3S0_9PROT|nr:glycosyltransferase [Parvularcula dongshanensis]MBB4658952.1 glycosyltransferase involved in cell wall biosynthesis [Parvularcula dongshanensis]